MGESGSVSGSAGGFRLPGRMGRGDGVGMDNGDDMARGVGSGRGEVFTMAVMCELRARCTAVITCLECLASSPFPNITLYRVPRLYCFR